MKQKVNRGQTGDVGWPGAMIWNVGSGKTVLLRSWISQAGAVSCAAWVPVGRAEHDPQQFWLSVLAAPRQADPGAAKQVMTIFGVPGEGEKDDRRIDRALSGSGS